MRILQISEPAAAGVGKHVIDLCQGLLQRGHEVHLIQALTRVDDNFSAGLQSLVGLRSHIVPMRRGPHPSDLIAATRIRRYIRDEGPFDIIHGQSSKGGAMARALGKGRAPVVYTPHCIYTMNPSLGRVSVKIFSGIERCLGSRTDAVIAVSPDEAAHLRDFIGVERILHLVPNGLRPPAWRSRSEARRELGLDEDRVTVGSIGRMTLQKNPLLLIEAFAVVAPKHPGAMLAMAGDGPLESQARALADNLGLRDRILWLGFRRPEDVMPAFDVFALPSLYEAMPYVLLEALSAGLPIVSTCVGGAQLTVEEGVNGHVTKSTAREFATGLDSTLSDQDRRRRMAKASLSIATKFTLDRMVDGTLQVYESLSRRESSQRSAG